MVSNYRKFHDQKDYDIGFTIKINNKMVAEKLKAYTALKIIFLLIKMRFTIEMHMYFNNFTSYLKLNLIVFFSFF